jgi:hypothetical protein
MAHFLCNCGEDLWNGRFPNDIEIRVFKKESWDRLLKNNTELVYMNEEYDIWKCPKCNRVYSFKNNEVDKMFKIEDNIKMFTRCLCGEQTDIKKYIAYTDKEYDNYTSDMDMLDTINNIRMPPRDLWSCGKCNRFYVKEDQKEFILVYLECDFLRDRDVSGNK